MKGFKHFIPQHFQRNEQIRIQQHSLIRRHFISQGHEPSKSNLLQSSDLIRIHRSLGHSFGVLFIFCSLSGYPTPEGGVALVLGGDVTIAKFCLVQLEFILSEFEQQVKEVSCVQIDSIHGIATKTCILTSFSSQLACPFRFAQRKPTAWRRSNRESVRDDVFPSNLFFCSIRCWWYVPRKRQNILC